MKYTKEHQDYLLKISHLDIDDVYKELHSSRHGILQNEVDDRVAQYGLNQVAREESETWYSMVLSNFTNPFILVLLFLGTVSYLTGNMRATLVVSIMVLVSVLMRFIQEFRSSKAAEKLRDMVLTKATVKRGFEEKEEDGETHILYKKSEIPFEEIVPGDIIYLSAGDMIPADVRLIRSKDLFISQSALTGESIPVEKYDTLANVVEKNISTSQENKNALEQNNLCFMGTSIVSGTGKAIVIHTGSRTHFGSLAKSIMGHRDITSFDKGVNSVTWLLIKFIVVMIPIVFLINGFVKGDWQESFLFAIAVAVGLTPEMLPMIVTANLARGAVAMSKHKVIVKRLNSIQNLGAMDILCTDKTGTLTQDRIILEKYLDINGNENEDVLEYGFLNSYYQSGLKNMIDRAILNHRDIEKQIKKYSDYKKIDEIPFDFIRRRMSVVLSKETDEHLLICKGAIEEILSLCEMVSYENKMQPLTNELRENVRKLAYDLNADGFRVIAIAYRTLPCVEKSYSVSDEQHLTLIGIMAFLDPPKESVPEAIKALHKNGVQIKILTGDNEIITRRICKQVNLPFDEILIGDMIEEMNDSELAKKAESTTIFAKLTPLQKARIIRTLQHAGHTVGFLGDGINDAAALRDADVGISVDSATDIARESADIILLEKNLLVLRDGVIKGREVYGNIIKYIKMTASSNFGNVFSVLIASAFLPFLPMLPLQLLVQNLFYDISQLALPWDKMDKDFLKKPRKWEPTGIARFMIFLGPTSSIFDITTFALMWIVYQANSLDTQSLFQSGWFVEGLLSQTLVVHLLRTQKIPFIQSIAATPLIIMTIVIMALGIYLPFSPLGGYLHLVHLPPSYFLWLVLTLLSYSLVVQSVKTWYVKKYKAWL